MTRALILLLVLLVPQVQAAIDTYEFSTPDRQERFSVLTDELRCPKCQNQNIADSNAPIANDLRREIYRMLEEGMSDDQIVDFLVDRYGDFVLYKPRFSAKTLVLWGGPVLFLLMGLVVLFGLLRKNRQAQITVRSSDKASAGANSPAAPLESLSDDEQQRLKQLLGEK
ncbi:cytochrome c-type biogenesis protein CcmH [Aestuariirhabdus sp. Z084]|uniref:cytochrome c-type biogenesis protein n=1 Tax=Aestuariirhabdus haliotis TaxID=2918751 RepID=UPI00201B3C3A|nr:cytochrome c-type biogenesis protein [Aestuariirhabdus haliotis]MCL6415548.1 cytochrome c-type biogenesis protein CcmH [Aestuariirhabdus haliotis]MCL6419247.1 cytochrome c-type biogenesis protein CcmH [Aestuariirhabdus haliotis]